MTRKELYRSLLFGVAVGDALGVPVEFKSRQYLKSHPVTGMMGYGTHHQPTGTWSDDSSMTFCLAEALTQNFDLNIIGQNFIKWYFNNYWTATGVVFDAGMATTVAIMKLYRGERPDLAGGNDESSNGNGSLMRISPLVFYIAQKPAAERFEITRQVSSITHGHIRSVVSCFYYLEFARKLLASKDKYQIYREVQTEVTDYLPAFSVDPAEIALFGRLLKDNIFDLPEDSISSSGYVLHTLEAAIWCLMTTDSYSDAVLRAVNLGDDTDTTAAVTGGLAGLLYGYDGIPKEWIRILARKDDIEELVNRLR